MDKHNNAPCPRVLIISHNALSQTKNNGKTLRSFFGSWDRENLAQFYITPEEPDWSVCKNYYLMRDIDILKSFFHKQKQFGTSLSQPSEKADAFVQEDTCRIYTWIKGLYGKKLPLLSIIRDFFWKGRWKTPGLVQWLDAFSPQAVFLQCSAPAIYELAFWVCDRYKIPLFLQITDDYVSGKFSIDPFFWIFLQRQRSVTRKAIQRAKKVIVIGEKMRDAYARIFGGEYYIAMNSVQYEPKKETVKHRDYIEMVYTGNLGLNRWKVLSQIGQLCANDDELRNHVKIKIYSSSKLKAPVLEELNIPGVMCFCGELNSEETRRKQQAADVLFHVESFDRKSRHITRYSISTKIPEYLATGNCIFAVGPKDVASIEYLQHYNLGIVQNSLDSKSCTKALKLLLDENVRIVYGKHGVERVKKYHNQTCIQQDLYNMIVKYTL